MRILFVTSNRLGDAVLSTGLLDHLIRTYPSARITIVCGPVAEGLFARMPKRERTIVLRKRDWGLHWLPLWAATATRLWDLVIDIRGSALGWLIPARRRQVFRRRGGRKTEELGAILNLAPAPLPVAWFSEQDRQAVAELIGSAAAIVAIGPTANWPPKTWAADRFAEAVRRIGIPGAVPVVLGGPGVAERAMAQKLLDRLPGAVDLVGRLTLPQVSACLSQARLFIGNDSGLMHMAAAAGAPTIGLFGPTDANIYGPAGPRSIAVTARSMDDISVESVVNAAHRLLASSGMTEGSIAAGLNPATRHGAG